MYQPQSLDTPIESDQLFFHLLRQQSVSARVMKASRHSRGINSLCLSGVKRRNPDAPPSVIREKFAAAKLGHIPTGLTFAGEDEAMWVQDSITLAQDLDRIFEENQIPYYVTGGVAASVHGEPRSTVDLDLVVLIDRTDVEELASILATHGFYCPEGAVEEVVRGVRRGFQATHQVSISSVDIYLSDGSEFTISELSRRVRLDEGFYVSSAEDTVLQKLKWRQQGQSEKQWRDILGILKLQQGDLDYTYLESWADNLGIAADLAQAIQATGGERSL